IDQQKRRELFRKNILRSDRVPYLVRHFVISRRRWRNAPETAIGEIFDLVVVVEHYAPEARDAKILEQQVAGEYVDCGELFERVAVIAYGAPALLGRGRLEKKVERGDAPLDVDMADDDRLAVFLDRRGRDVLELRDQLRRAAPARDRNVGILERIRHPSDAVVVLDQKILRLHRLRSGLFRRRDLVPDHLEYVRE